MVGCYLAIPLKSINAKPFSILIMYYMYLWALIVACHSKRLGSRRCGSSQIINFFYGFLVCSFVYYFQNSNEINCFVLPYLTMLSFAVFTLNVVDLENTVDKEISFCLDQLSYSYVAFHVRDNIISNHGCFFSFSISIIN